MVIEYDWKSNGWQQEVEPPNFGFYKVLDKDSTVYVNAEGHWQLVVRGSCVLEEDAINEATALDGMESFDTLARIMAGPELRGLRKAANRAVNAADALLARLEQKGE